jgi:hypothetical protein
MFSFQQDVVWRMGCPQVIYGRQMDAVLDIYYNDDLITKLGKQLTTLTLSATCVTDVGYLHLKNCPR